MKWKDSRFYSVLGLRCPRCHEGRLFTHRAYSSRFSEMPEKCSHCGLRFSPEPSFFTGAMYVSYALQVALVVTLYVAFRVLWDPPFEVYFFTTVVAAIALLPVTLRLSRAIYINLFVGYQRPEDRT